MNGTGEEKQGTDLVGEKVTTSLPATRAVCRCY